MRFVPRRSVLMAAVAATAALAAIPALATCNASQVDIEITSSGFQPDHIQRPAGATATWRNGDSVAHVIQVDSSGTDTVEPGNRLSLHFVHNGSMTYQSQTRPSSHFGSINFDY